MASKKTAIVTGASQGIGAAVARAFLDRGYNVVGNARRFSSESFTPSPNLALVEGDIGLAMTAEKIAQTAIEKFGSIDHVVSNAGIFSSKPFTDYTADEFPVAPGVVDTRVRCPKGRGDVAAMNADNKLAMKPSAAEHSHSWSGLSCPECEERSYLRMLVAELLYRNQVLRFDLIEARDQVERIDDPTGEQSQISRPRKGDLQ